VRVCVCVCVCVDMFVGVRQTVSCAAPLIYTYISKSKIYKHIYVMFSYEDMPPLPECVIERDFSALKTRHWWCCVWVFIHSTQCIAHAILIAMRTTAECAFKSKC